MLELVYRHQRHWPRLAWLAELTRGTATVTVQHGTAVEITPEWFCEAVWDGAYSEGAFDRTDIVAGSGGRVREGVLTLVSSGSTVDRLQAIHLGNRVLVSNSMVCLLAGAGASLDPAYPRYPAAFFSAIKGLDRYVRTVPCSAGAIEFCYFDNLVWDGQALSRSAKPNADRSFADFAGYRGFLTSALAQIANNLRDRSRSTAYGLLGTLSTGYDSTLATVLMKPLGMEQVLCFERPSLRDSGTANARLLGVTPIVIPVESWRSLAMPEVPFIAGDGVGEEVHFSAAEHALRQRVLFTGYHGDKVWEKDTPYTAPTLVRGDISGMSLSEYRLWAGFIHCPIAFFGARQVADIKRISNLPEMKPWDVGGHYTRPICRRIIEDAGLPRDAFGTKKSYASRWFATDPDYLTDASFRSFLNWMRARRGQWLRRGRLPPLLDTRFDRWRIRVVKALSSLLVMTPGFHRFGLSRFKPFQLMVSLDENEHRDELPLYGFRRYAMPWAVEEAKKRYARAVVSRPASPSRSQTDEQTWADV